MAGSWREQGPVSAAAYAVAAEGGKEGGKERGREEGGREGGWKTMERLHEKVFMSSRVGLDLFSTHYYSLILRGYTYYSFSLTYYS